MFEEMIKNQKTAKRTDNDAVRVSITKDNGFVITVGVNVARSALFDVVDYAIVGYGRGAFEGQISLTPTDDEKRGFKISRLVDNPTHYFKFHNRSGWARDGKAKGEDANYRVIPSQNGGLYIEVPKSMLKATVSELFSA